MGRYRFVDAELERLPLSDGDWIDVKKVLNAGEYRQLIVSQFKDSENGDPPTLDPSKVGVSKVLAYLVGWSFTDRAGKPIPYGLEQPEAERLALLDNQDKESYRELLAAIVAHDEAQDAKKNPGTGGSS